MRSMSCSTVSVTPLFRRRGSRCCSSSSEASCGLPIEPAAETKCTSAPAAASASARPSAGYAPGLVGDHDAAAERADIVTRAREGAAPSPSTFAAAAHGDRRAIGPARARAARLPVRARGDDDRVGLARRSARPALGSLPSRSVAPGPLERRDEILDRVRPAVARGQPGEVAQVPARQLRRARARPPRARARRRSPRCAGRRDRRRSRSPCPGVPAGSSVPCAERRLAAGGGGEHARDLLRAQRAPDADVRADAARGLGLAALARLAHEVRVGEVRARHRRRRRSSRRPPRAPPWRGRRCGRRRRRRRGRRRAASPGAAAGIG